MNIRPIGNPARGPVQASRTPGRSEDCCPYCGSEIGRQFDQALNRHNKPGVGRGQRVAGSGNECPGSDRVL